MSRSNQAHNSSTTTYPVSSLVRPLVAVAAILWAGAGVGAEADYPTKPIRMLVGFSPGGGVDFVGRLIGRRLSASLGQQVIIDNRAGAGGLLASDMTAKANPDGYTLLCASSSLVIQPSITKKMPFDTARDLAPITLVATAPYMLVANPAVPVKSVKDLIALAKAHPGKLSYASAGIGSGLHLAGELFKSMAGVHIVEVSYKGVVGVTDVIAGNVPIGFTGLVQTLPLVRAGKLRALGVTGASRSSVVPDIPTIAEAGVPGYDVSIWYGILATGGTPKRIVDKLNSEIVRALRESDVRDPLLKLGLEPAGNSAEEYGQTIRKEIAKWAKVVKQAGIQPN